MYTFRNTLNGWPGPLKCTSILTKEKIKTFNKLKKLTHITEESNSFNEMIFDFCDFVVFPRLGPSSVFSVKSLNNPIKSDVRRLDTALQIDHFRLHKTE
jgi:hypothetical protein